EHQQQATGRDRFNSTFSRLSSPGNPLKPYSRMKTDSNGEVRFTLSKSSQQKLWAYYDGKLGWVERERFFCDSGPVIELSLETAASVDGRVVLASGCAVSEGGTITLHRDDSGSSVDRTVQIAGDGSFSTSAVYRNPFGDKSDGPVRTMAPPSVHAGPMEAGRYKASIYQPHWNPVVRSIEIKAGANKVDLDLTNFGGLIVDVPANTSMTGAQLDHLGSGYVDWQKMLSENQINLGCVEAADTQISFWSPESGWDRPSVKVESGKMTHVALQLKPGGTITGRWRDSDIKPFSISAHDGTATFTVKMNEDRSFVFKNLSPGDWLIRGNVGKISRRSEEVHAILDVGTVQAVEIGVIP
ncbi:MAG: hypothetical protein WCL39_09830, partial [Armatimonadota bacterium]